MQQSLRVGQQSTCDIFDKIVHAGPPEVLPKV